MAAPAPAGLRRRRFTVDTANRLLIDAYDDRPSRRLTTRAWPLDGGAAAWHAEVRAALARGRAADESEADEDARYALLA